MNTKEFGQITESKFVFECSKLGIKVSRPIGDTAPYDFIIDIDNKLFKVQCKSMSKKSNGYHCQTHKKVGHRRTEKATYAGLIDIFFFYNLEDDIFAYVNVENCGKNIILKIKSRQSNSKLISNFQNIYSACKL